VLSQTMQGLQNCLDNKVMTGVCTSLCQTNFDDLLREEWVDRLIDMGVLYTWYHVYRPMGPDPAPELALTPEQQRKARQFVVDMRCKKPWGDIEPCPIIQFAKDSIHDERPLEEVFNESDFLKDFRRTAAQHTRGCIVLERPDLIEDLAKNQRRFLSEVGRTDWPRRLPITIMACTTNTFLPTNGKTPKTSIRPRVSPTWCN